MPHSVTPSLEWSRKDIGFVLTFGESFRLNGWEFCQPALPDRFAHQVAKEWPPRFEFEPPRYAPRFYDTWRVAGDGDIDVRLTRYGAVCQLVSFLNSADACSTIASQMCDGQTRIPTSTVLSRVRRGSILLPHKDKLGLSDPYAINLIIFIASDQRGFDAGGTGLFSDATFDRPIFEPGSLTNSALVYRLQSDLFHGFPRVRKDSYRFAIVQTYRTPHHST